MYLCVLCYLQAPDTLKPATRILTLTVFPRISSPPSSAVRSVQPYSFPNIVWYVPLPIQSESLYEAFSVIFSDIFFLCNSLLSSCSNNAKGCLILLIHQDALNVTSVKISFKCDFFPCFLAFEDMLENPNTSAQYINDPEIGPVLLQISRIVQSFSR